MIHTDLITTVPELLTRQAREYPDKIAFHDIRQQVTYADLDARTARLAGHLLDLGLGPKERFLMYLDNSIEVVEGYLVAPRAGVVAVCANPTATQPELTYIAQNSGARILITDEAHLAIALRTAQDVPGLTTVIVTGSCTPPTDPPTDITLVYYDDLVHRDSKASTPDETGMDEWTWMLYTSGTTGRPKGVQLSQRGCLWVVAACWVPIVGLSADDHLLSYLPLFHSYALVLSIIGVAAVGATATLLPKYSPRDVRVRLASEGVTLLPGVPTMFQYLINTRESRECLNAPKLRLCISAGAIMSGALNQEFEQYAAVPLLDGYGITETSTMVTMNAPTGGRVPGSCGVPVPGISVRFVGPNGVDVPYGDEGELWVQGPNVMLGYHALPDATAAAMDNGWYRTGDLGRRDRNGFISITGRVKELIIRAGENIAPAEVEEVILTCSGVDDAAVVGAPHHDLGEVPVVFVVPTSGHELDHEHILAVCRENLAYFKVPEQIIEVSQIPRTPSGKIRRFELKPQISASTSTSSS
ncbi:class I adenylate-forming enzyme family protein [Rhodococcus sp. T2V]|uniref:class I adenylate-forming enzyme family protein n=1 Tax=Rhodococcus sp. T2V TaxID=3034164 RepID=UPI0023E227C7|nr:class I adenylate-forming enzyme family protein [Rhodococcus sp. T2V]MDF3312206.1 class I adenylate-forming enzyme family protein [Rhodococcus sp. T2V]